MLRMQLPLPKHLNEEAIISAVDPRKDVDGFHPNHRCGKLSSGCSALGDVFQC